MNLSQSGKHITAAMFASVQVTQKSLRRAIGVVPQDTVLFNADIE